jgi:energy-coupling factor transporter ATP-binding protein EcfA2
MNGRIEKLDTPLARLDALLAAAVAGAGAAARGAAQRWRADAAALRFHLNRRAKAGAALVAVLGGTGTGKSTLVNRLLGANVSAASFRRTFTSGAVAVARRAGDVPDGWLGIDHVRADGADLPVRGQIGTLLVVEAPPESSPDVVLIDTPDLDGDQPPHHAQADRAFRWADAVLFLVTPEKYQMTELLPYYRLARRYAVPALFVMNKCEEPAVLEDYRALLERGAGENVQRPTLDAQRPNDLPERDPPIAAEVFAIARDDAGYEPPAGANVEALRRALSGIRPADGAARERGLRARSADLLGRFGDQVLAPMRDERRAADSAIAALRAMEAPAVGVDVNPITQQLRRRMQERSVLYLIGPGRILDRVRQAPGLLMRLPRVAWDYVAKGTIDPADLSPAAGGGDPRKVPDFPAVLRDQFAVLQSRIDDAIRGTPAGARWLADPASAAGYAAARFDPAAAGAIADEELAALRDWLEKRWNATPRDTKILETFLKHMPGGRQLSKWSEAAPYLLTAVLVTHHAFFGHIDLLVLGGYGLATWLTEKISNEVAGRTRAANARIAERYAQLAHDQIRRVTEWLDRLAPPTAKLDALESAANDAAQAAGL